MTFLDEFNISHCGDVSNENYGKFERCDDYDNKSNNNMIVNDLFTVDYSRKDS